MSDFMDGIVAEEKPTALSEVMLYVDKLKEIRDEIAEREAALKELKKQDEKLSMEIIPTYFQQHGISELALENGQKVLVKEDLAASVPVKDLIKREAVIKWLIQHGGGDLVKDTLTIEDPEVDTIKYLTARGYSPEVTVAVNSNSLKAFLKEALGMKKGAVATISAQDVPPELSLYVYSKTDIK